MKIIIVEDEQRAREGLAKLITSLSSEYEVIGQAGNGQSALDMILKYQPDVIFTDIKMPIMDGITMTRMVRAHGIKSEFVVISAYGDFDMARQFISLGVAEYMLKPVTKESLELTLKRLQIRLGGGNMNATESHVSLREQYPEAHPLILKALDIIERCYSGKINLKELAQELNVSAEYFSYLFAKNTGKTFSNFIRDYRIEQAKFLYRKGKLDKKEVPYAVGFSDAKYFCQVFKKVTGETPSEYLLKIL